MQDLRWDPNQYARYSDERSRPFHDLIGQIGAAAPSSVVDLGCGTGNVTVALCDRWPNATVQGIDSSSDMIAAAARYATDSLQFTLGSATDFAATGVDVLVSNAMLQWVPDHVPLLRRWAAELNDDGWLAFQVPANFGGQSHVLMRELASSGRWRDQLGSVLRGADSVASPETYLDVLAGAGLRVNAWQTTYLHVLQGADPVLEWVRGTGLRPVLQALDDADRVEFEVEYAARLREAYPAQDYGTVFPFTRTFVVGHKP